MNPLTPILLRLIPAHAGKTVTCCTPPHLRAGSSPLTRGKRIMGQQAARGQGLIPAHAGKTTSSSAWTPPTWGSSPLTRGKPAIAGIAAKKGRLIPAHAGKTDLIGVERDLGEAHPRSRGENRPILAPWIGVAGSSPLTRGKLQTHLARTANRGLIPAHAGKTSRWERRRGCPWAHPRSRGENSLMRASAAVVVGSSPLTRGKRAHDTRFRRAVGLIPAHAGKTNEPSFTALITGAHPRSRGENWWMPVARGLRAGSSPLTRGKHGGPTRRVTADRLIPAHAGKTVTPSDPPVAWKAHPRSRGENARPVRPRDMARGSSPLTRGKRQLHYLRSLPGGLIPAHAGKTS